MDLKLVNDGSDPFDGDLDLTNNEVTTVDGADAIRQHLQIRFQFFLGEWFLDVTIGVPWFRDILIKQPSFPVVQDVLKNTALDTPGVIELTKFVFDFVSSDREASLEFDCLSDEGPIDFSQIVEVAS